MKEIALEKSCCRVSREDFSCTALRQPGPVLIEVSTIDLAQTVADIGRYWRRDVNRLIRFSLIPPVASKVPAPSIDECFVTLGGDTISLASRTA